MIFKLFFALTPLVLLLASLSLFLTSKESFKKKKKIYKQLRDMGSEVVQYFTIFLSFLLFASGSSVAETPPLEEIQKARIADNQENQIPFAFPVFTTQFDAIGTVPIVNPTTPGTTSPIVNPIEPPPAPAIVTTPPTPPATTTPTPPATTTPSSSGGSWCIASPTASETALQVALDYACGYGGADCSAIQSGASCYNPITVRDHASYAFNDYYQKNPIPTSCVFGGTAQLINTDPSNGNCHFASPKSTPSLSPPVNPTPTTPATPTTMSPPITATPGGSTIYGVAEPTGLPSSASSVSFSLLLLCSTMATMGSLLAANHL